MIDHVGGRERGLDGGGDRRLLTAADDVHARPIARGVRTLGDIEARLLWPVGKGEGSGGGDGVAEAEVDLDDRMDRKHGIRNFRFPPHYAGGIG